MKVLIIGAGPAGCALAHGLKKASIPFSIFERTPVPERTRNWAFTLGWARPYLTQLLPDHIASQLSTCQVDPSIDCTAIGEDRIVIYNGKTRQETFTFPIPNASEMNIGKLQGLLVKDLDVRYGKKFTRFEAIDAGGVAVYFEDGTKEEGDIVVGTDGAGSRLRQQLLGKAARPDLLPFALMNFNARYSAEQARYINDQTHALVDIAVHPEGHYIRTNVLDMPDPSDASTWIFQILSTWVIKNVVDYDNEEDRLKRLKEHVRRAGWADPYKSIIEWVPNDTEVLRDQLKVWKPVKWDHHGGRTTLCGDAAHAMTFHRGQGANNALYDAFCFVEAMTAVKAGKPMEEAVEEYDKNVVQRGQSEVQISKAQTFFTHDWENFASSPVMTLGTRPSHGAKTEGYE